jgi:hypothetical protein
MKAYYSMTSVSIPGWPSGAASSGLQVVSSVPLVGFNNYENLTIFVLYLKFWSWTSWSSLQVVQIKKKQKKLH